MTPPSVPKREVKMSPAALGNIDHVWWGMRSAAVCYVTPTPASQLVEADCSFETLIYVLTFTFGVVFILNDSLRRLVVSNSLTDLFRPPCSWRVWFNVRVLCLSQKLPKGLSSHKNTGPDCSLFSCKCFYY